jgi:hypothetical protein
MDFQAYIDDRPSRLIERCGNLLVTLVSFVVHRLFIGLLGLAGWSI